MISIDLLVGAQALSPTARSVLRLIATAAARGAPMPKNRRIETALQVAGAKDHLKGLAARGLIEIETAGTRRRAFVPALGRWTGWSARRGPAPRMSAAERTRRYAGRRYEDQPGFDAIGRPVDPAARGPACLPVWRSPLADPAGIEIAA